MGVDLERRLKIANAFSDGGDSGSLLRTVAFSMLADIAELLDGDVSKSDIIGGNEDCFLTLLKETIYLAVVKIGTDSNECKVIAKERPKLKNLFKDSSSMKDGLNKLKGILDVESMADDVELDELIATYKSYNPEKRMVVGYDPDTMDALKRNIKEQLIDSWKGMYQYSIDGLESLDGIVIPSGILENRKGKKQQGILSTHSKTLSNLPFQYAEALYKEFIGACKDVGINISENCCTDANDIGSFKYNPFLQWKIATGVFNRSAFKEGWDSYSKTVLEKVVDRDAEIIAVEKNRTGSDDGIYRVQSAYCTSLCIVNYKKGLGFQVRACCGVGLKAEKFAEAFRRRLEVRESGSNSLNFGKATIGDKTITPGGSCVLTVYLDMESYYRVPDFLGEHVIKQENFRPSMRNMIIGRKLDNSIMTLDMETANTGWCVPIVAGSRSGKGVLTLSMVGNVIACELPLFYLDGKPDMSTLFLELAQKAGVAEPMIVDCIKISGTTPIDQKEFSFAYKGKADVALASPNAHPVLASNITAMIYVKMLYVIRLSLEYNNSVLKGPPLFVVMDEIYALAQRVGLLYNSLKSQQKKLTGEKHREAKEEIMNIIDWLDSIFSEYVMAGIGIFGGGIKVLALSQYDAITDYRKVAPSDSFSSFVETVGLKGAGKARIYGKKQAPESAAQYSLNSKNISRKEFNMIMKYRYFALSDGRADITSDDIFKPLLVLNECDAVEELHRQGKEATKDGVFTGTMMGEIPDEVVGSFRDKYFKDPRMAASIGFEGALGEIARGIGKSPIELIRNTFESSSKLATDALKYYQIIGNNGINSVYDWLVSTDASLLWKLSDIQNALISGKPLIPIGDSDESIGDSDGSGNSLGGFDGLEEELELVDNDYELADDEPELPGNAGRVGINSNDIYDNNVYNIGNMDNGNRDNIGEESTLKHNLSTGIILDADDTELLEEMRLAEAAKRQREAYMANINNEQSSVYADTESEVGEQGEYGDQWGYDNGQDEFNYEQEESDVGFDGEYTNDEIYNNRNESDNLGNNSTDGKVQNREIEFNGSNTNRGERFGPNGWKAVSEVEVDNLVNRIVGSAPSNVGDILDYMAYCIQQALDNKKIDPYLAEALARRFRLKDLGHTTAYTYYLNNVRLVRSRVDERNHNPYVDSGDGKSAVSSTGKNQKNTMIDADRTEITSVLNDTNSIDCRRAGVAGGSLVDKLLLGTPKGAQRYRDKLWDSILVSAIEQGYKTAVISRVTLKDDNMTMNGKILILDGVIGGRDNIRLSDIVSFRILFKRYPLISVLRIDNAFLRSGLTEFGDNVVERLFEIGKRLEYVDIINDGQLVRCTRENVLSDRRYKEASMKAKMSNAIDMECIAKRSADWDSSNDGDNIWGMRLASASMGKSAKAFQEKSAPGLVKSVVCGAGGLVIGTVGAAAWGVTNVAKSIWGLRKSFRG